MNMKRIIPIVMIAAMPVAGMAQNKSGLDAKNFDKNGVRRMIFTSSPLAVGKNSTLFLLLTAVSAASTSFRRTTTNVSTPSSMS